MNRSSPLRRRTPLKSGSGLARTGGPKRKRRRTLTKLERAEAAIFKASVRGKRCAACGCVPVPYWTMKAHHVVEADWLRRHYKPVYDPRNALPVCGDCHANHHSTRRIPLSALTEDNWAFAREVLGEAADHYLRRYYREETDG